MGWVSRMVRVSPTARVSRMVRVSLTARVYRMVRASLTARAMAAGLARRPRCRTQQMGLRPPISRRRQQKKSGAPAQGTPDAQRESRSSGLAEQR
jgi:hypothetical protein